MTERKLKPADNAADAAGRQIDDDYVDMRVMVGNDLSRTLEIKSDDPFAQGSEVFKTFSGASEAIKKRAQRSFKKYHQGTDGAASTKIEGRTLDGYNLFGVVTPPYNMEYLAQLLTVSAPHAAAVNAKVSNIVGLGFDLVDSNVAKDQINAAGGDKRKVKRMRRKLAEAKNMVLEWLSECHEEEEFEETLRNFYTDFEATGNGYLEIGRTANGEIGYIGHIPSVSMRVRKERDGFVQIIADKAVFFKHFGDTETTNPINSEEPNEVIHLKKYSPIDSYYGIPDIISAMQAVTGNEFAGRYNLDYFENKATPRYVIVLKGSGMGPSDHQSVLDFFESSVKGQNHRTIIIPLPPDIDGTKADFKMEPVETGAQDASFVNYNKINLQNILMAERVPMTKIGTAEGVNLAVARDADKTFKEQVCRPAQKILEKKLNRLVSEKTNLLKFKLNELTLTDEDTQSKIDERYLRMQTILPNEVRARWGWTAIEGGDEVVDLKANTTDASSVNNRQRDSVRSAGATDSAGEGRNTKGDGRATP